MGASYKIIDVVSVGKGRPWDGLHFGLSIMAEKRGGGWCVVG